MVSGLPAWSVHEATGITSIAGLPVSSAMVGVGPPLLAGPAVESSGLVLLRLPVAVKPHELSLEMLKPASMIVPEQLRLGLPPEVVLPATIVFLRVAEPPLRMPPAAPVLAVLLPDKVLLVMA